MSSMLLQAALLIATGLRTGAVKQNCWNWVGQSTFILHIQNSLGMD